MCGSRDISCNDNAFIHQKSQSLIHEVSLKERCRFFLCKNKLCIAERSFSTQKECLWSKPDSSYKWFFRTFRLGRWGLFSITGTILTWFLAIRGSSNSANKLTITAFRGAAPSHTKKKFVPGKEKVYTIPFSCGRQYIGQTGRCTNHRLWEHYNEVSKALPDSYHPIVMQARSCTDCRLRKGHGFHFE